MFNHLLLIIAFVAFTCSDAIGQNQEQIISNYLNAMEDQGFSGSILVAKEGVVLHKAGYGFADREKTIKNTPSTVFTTGSITKPFTGAAILKLEMMGKINVNDLMSKYIDDVPKDKEDITIHNLLTHSSGFPGSIGRDDELISKKDFLKDAMSTSLRFIPGENYRYSNVGFSILAIILEKQSGMTYEQFLQTHLFKPAGMNSTGYVLAKGLNKREAIGYNGDGEKWGKMTDKNWGTEGPGWHLKGNGGILSTVEDMYQYDQALRKNVILNDQAKAKHYTRHVEEGKGSDTYYGYGWAIYPTPRNTDLITHNGGNGIFFADFLRYIEEDITIVFMTNSASRRFESIPWEIARILLRPDYIPNSENGGKDLSKAEEEIIESLAMSFISVVGSPDKGSWKSFIIEHTTKDFQDMAEMDFHLEMFGKMHESLKDAQPRTAELENGELVIGMSNGLELALGFEADGTGRYLIGGISIN